MALTEKEMSFLEEHIPELAHVAFKQAYWAALASGSSVLVSDGGNLVEVFPDGKHKFIKHLPPATLVVRGQKLEMKTDQVPAWFKKALGSKFDIESKKTN